MIVWTPAVLSVLYACFVFLYLHLFSATEHVSHQRHSRNTSIIVVIIIIIVVVVLLLLLLVIIIITYKLYYR